MAQIKRQLIHVCGASFLAQHRTSLSLHSSTAAGAKYLGYSIGAVFSIGAIALEQARALWLLYWVLTLGRALVL
jgi:hypothetical protein